MVRSRQPLVAPTSMAGTGDQRRRSARRACLTFANVRRRQWQASNARTRINVYGNSGYEMFVSRGKNYRSRKEVASLSPECSLGTRGSISQPIWRGHSAGWGEQECLETQPLRVDAY